MSSSSPLRALSAWKPGLRLYVEPKPESREAYWFINGYRARLLIWTADEWRRMAITPADAQYHPCGVWCALRVD
jgi:hypothetical protein